MGEPAERQVGHHGRRRRWKVNKKNRKKKRKEGVEQKINEGLRSVDIEAKE